MPQPLIAYEESSCITPKRSREGENPKSPKQRTSETQAECGNVGVEATKLQVLFYSFLGGDLHIVTLTEKQLQPSFSKI